MIGPHVLHWARVTPGISLISGIGLTFLFFMAGYELDIDRVRGRPLRNALEGWVVGLVVAFAISATLVASGFAISTLLIGLVLTTTALGTLLPMLADNGELETDLGTATLAIGGVGEFLPVIATTLLLTGRNPAGTAVLLVVFVLLAIASVFVAFRPLPKPVARIFGRTLGTSSQLPIRVAVLIVTLLVFIASRLGLDVLLGAFAAGFVVSTANRGKTAELVEAKLSAIAYGFFVPVFFIVTGMQFDTSAFTSGIGTLLRIPMFLGLFYVVRGLPTLWSHRRSFGWRDRVALSLLASTALPMIVAITQVGLQRHEMKPQNTAALVAAGMLSVVVFPTSAFALRGAARPVADASVPLVVEPE